MISSSNLSEETRSQHMHYKEDQQSLTLWLGGNENQDINEAILC